MTADKLNRFWLMATFLLILIIVLGSLVIWMRHDKGRPIEIISAPAKPVESNVNTDNAASSPRIPQPQLIDLNQAELWLLETLPGIGEIRAQAIIDYRLQNGPFRNIRDITNVPGIGDSTFQKIQNFVTVTP
jgi:comEA protein